jgi:hypothetical protein
MNAANAHDSFRIEAAGRVKEFTDNLLVVVFGPISAFPY